MSTMKTVLFLALAISASAVETEKVSHKAMKARRAHENNLETVLKWQQEQTEATNAAAKKMQDAEATAKAVQQRSLVATDSRLKTKETDELEEVQREFLEAFHFDSSHVGEPLVDPLAKEPVQVDPMETYQKSLRFVRAQETNVKKQQDAATEQMQYLATQEGYIREQQEKNAEQDRLREYEAQHIVGLDSDQYKAAMGTDIPTVAQDQESLSLVAKLQSIADGALVEDDEDTVNVHPASYQVAAANLVGISDTPIDDAALQKIATNVQKNIDATSKNELMQDSLAKRQADMISKVEAMNEAQLKKNAAYTQKMANVQGVSIAAGDAKTDRTCVSDFVSITNCGVNNEEDCVKVGIFAGSNAGMTTFTLCEWNQSANICGDANARECDVEDAVICSTNNPYPNLFCGATGKKNNWDVINALKRNSTA